MTSAPEDQLRLARHHRRRLGLAPQIVIGLAAGIAIGLALIHYPQYRDSMVTGLLHPAGNVFLKLVKMVIVPLVFCSMVVGIAEIGDGKALGRIGLKTLVYFEATTTIAIVIGMVLGNAANTQEKRAEPCRSLTSGLFSASSDSRGPARTRTCTSRGLATPPIDP